MAYTAASINTGLTALGKLLDTDINNIIHLQRQ